ncbi:BgTH12-06737 [Blumeria graminis f. sp. triticale]|uniref:BgTH12-06737 n=1 Tax=Blumeria graminis f. sp. triticale TaxID=1689686 RepID=A0A9W4GCZ8_BLUGR|nr:BgTH12-06737 [Blumeria graminis f. sp. triticale]
MNLRNFTVTTLRISQHLWRVQQTNIIKSSLTCSKRSILAKSTSTTSNTKRFGRYFAQQSRFFYHAGTGRTVFLGCLKITTIFIFGFFSLVVIPKHVLADKKVPWVTGTIAISGLVPMVFVAYITGPFVTYVHVRIPSFARNSKQMIVRFAKSIPPETELDFTTMNIFGKPRVSRAKVKDIYAIQRRFGMVNFVRDTSLLKKSKAWWKVKAVDQFGVHGRDSGFLNGEVWNLIRKNIEKKTIR